MEASLDAHGLEIVESEPDDDLESSGVSDLENINIVVTNHFPNGDLCPGLSCRDKLPLERSPQLASALKQYSVLYRTSGRDAALRIGMKICTLVRKEHEKLAAVELAAERGWPVTSIDFKNIPSRILAQKKQLERIIFVSKARENLTAWISFSGDLEENGWTIANFSRLAPSAIPQISITVKNARVG